jgi:ABC-type Zn uptake system ZnuABC Zn-binding protein ZnuA
MIYDIAHNIGGDRVRLDMIVPIGGDPHIHEPTPSDAQKVNKAQLILVNGLTFEGWMNELIENSGTTGKTITVTQGIEPLTSITYKNSADPHAWMIASNGIIYADNIRKALIELLPEHSEEFTSNFQKYKSQLEELDQYIFDRIASIPGDQRILITSHDAFQYYGRKYGLQLEAIMGISTDAEAQTSDIIRVNRVIREKKVPAVFIESTINPKMIKQIASDNNVRIGGKLFADSLGDKNSPADTYIHMLKSNTDTIVNALSSKSTESQEVEKTNFGIYALIGLLLVGILFLGVRQINK